MWHGQLSVAAALLLPTLLLLAGDVEALKLHAFCSKFMVKSKYANTCQPCNRAGNA
jgi:hypothetical protein